MKKVDAILTGDWHLREDKPIARTDNYEEEQWRKVDFIANFQKKYGCVVLHSGDLFHHWKPSPALISKTIEHLPDLFYTVYGNHDLPQHNLELANKSGVYTLWKAGKLNIMAGTHWGENPEIASIIIKGRRILVWHTMTYKGKNLPYPDCKDDSTKKLLKKYNSDFYLIHTGHYHITFKDEYKGTLIVNAGSLMRMNAEQINHKPMVYLYNAKSNTVTPKYLPISNDVVSREHIDLKKEKDGRIASFVAGLDTDFGTTISFDKNMEKFISQNKVPKKVLKVINKYI